MNGFAFNHQPSIRLADGPSLPFNYATLCMLIGVPSLLTSDGWMALHLMMANINIIIISRNQHRDLTKLLIYYGQVCVLWWSERIVFYRHPSLIETSQQIEWMARS